VLSPSPSQALPETDSSDGLSASFSLDTAPQRCFSMNPSGSGASDGSSSGGDGSTSNSSGAAASTATQPGGRSKAQIQASRAKRMTARGATRRRSGGYDTGAGGNETAGSMFQQMLIRQGLAEPPGHGVVEKGWRITATVPTVR